ncbi:Fungal specific transcription factor domain-containing protein [Colletotrichum higginsianum IMI 349063]|uniref:Fungal specific transcription factor domain-containing protein n=2 Tax=Colletotrichum higginsianum TaxID=80884 RepID=A0A1B7Y6G2_COLHI|nr:Fungal specific transcription factor domain-containing protein [Colletotrichum higginsianum IMI 349063]OBR07555.1 Fungal specific transcription factor domain-containing protein [Colletotrichum higginsianum IMI 349063]
MSASVYESMNGISPPGVHPVAMSRPQVGIERLPTRRLSNEPRESMNCKSCRKRKIKCNRLRPSCEACQVFQCPCVYDAVPKKRGPKTDVLEALLKRVDGLEAKLKEKNAGDKTPTTPTTAGVKDEDASRSDDAQEDDQNPNPKRLALDTKVDADESAVYSPAPASEPSPPSVQPDALLDTYFTRFHSKPYHILDESSVRQRLQLNQLPNYLVHGIYAVAARYTPHPSGYQSAVQLSEEFASRARAEIDTDEPSVDALQALLLLVIAFTAAGKGKKAYMLMMGMAMALETHREMDSNARVTPVEREMRRRLFWTCYLLDRFLACGSKRPSLVGDKTILLRLPCWSPNPSVPPVDGEFFQSGSNLQFLQGSGKKSQGSTGMLIDISRILGITNRYLAAGGVKGDSHFPWHSLSNLSKIRQDLDIWASGTEDVFSSLDTLFGQPDSTILVLSKLIYHLIHCLIYRPFLPIDLAELAGTGQHQSWQIEATNMCFLHANAISELVELGKQTGTIEWPAFVGYCICTAGTVHIHGAHYNKHGSGDSTVFSMSADFLSREMQQLSELRYAWASVQHQRETLQGIYNAHSELVKSLANNPMRYSPAFHLEDFFDRYSNIGGPGGQTFNFDAANLSLSDVVVDFTTDTYTGHDLYAPRANSMHEAERPNLKRKNTAPSGRKRPDAKVLSPLSTTSMAPPNGLPTPSHTRHSFSHPTPTMAAHPSPGLLGTPTSLPPHPEVMEHPSMAVPHGHYDETAANNAAVAAAAAAGFSLGHQPHHQGNMSALPTAPFSPQFSFATPGPSGNNEGGGSYDPMFGGLPTNAFGSPAAWHGDEGGNKIAGVAAPSPGNRSNNGSTGTGPGEEKDPFLSLLEQLAENEHHFARGPGSELDFFFGGTGATQ